MTAVSANLFSAAFFKLIFSDKKASDAFWAIAEKVHINPSYISNTKKAFAKFPYNQFRSLEYAEMRPAIQVFFGKSVNVGVVSLGSPWDYFSNELANADHSAISLRPFINSDRSMGFKLRDGIFKAMK